MGILRTYNLLLRTRLPLHIDRGAITGIFAYLAHRQYVLKIKGALPWKNGVAAIFDADEDIRLIMSELAEEFANLDMWAVHDGRQFSAEKHGDGPIGLMMATKPHQTLMHVFVKYKDFDRDIDRTSELIRAAIGQQARRVFHFENGAVFMVRSDQPPSLIPRRLEQVRRHFQSGASGEADGFRVLDIDPPFGRCWSPLPSADIT